MRLFWKHLLRCMVRKPLQPIVLIFTLMVSLAVSQAAFTIEDSLAEETALSQAAKYGSADLSVNLNGTSESRFMFTERARELLSGKAEVAGVYELPLLFGEESDVVFGVACDFHEIGKIFSLRFTDHGTITESRLRETALISLAFSEKYGLSVGDRFSSKLLGVEKVYEVGAISEDRFAADYDVMVDITGVVQLIGKDSLVISALGDDFKPCSTIYIDVKDGVTHDECIALLCADPDFSENSFTVIAEAINGASNVSVLSIAVDIAILLTTILTAAVTFCCFYILSDERTEQNAVFLAAGTKPLLLDFMQYLEILVYWLIGSGLGAAFSFPLIRLAKAVTSFEYATLSPTPIIFLKSTAIILAAALSTVTLFILAQKIKKNPKDDLRSRRIYLPAVLLISGILIILLFTVNETARFAVGVACLVSILLALFMLAPAVLRFIMKHLSRHCDKKLQKNGFVAHPSLHYAIKNLYSIRFLHNFSRLVVLLVSATLSLALVIVSTHGSFQVTTGIFKGELAVINATESCRQKALMCESALRVDKALLKTARKTDDKFTYAIAVSDADALSELTEVSITPKGKLAVVSSDHAKLFSLKIGDSYTITVDGQPLELEVAEIADIGFSAVVFDCEHFGIPYNMLLVQGKEGVSTKELLGDLTEITSAELAAITPTSELIKTRIKTVSVYLDAANLLLVIMLCFCLVGMLDNLSQSYRARREEFALYACCGMSKKQIRHMKTLEVLICAGFGILLAAVAFIVCAIVINQSMLTFGSDTFVSFSKLFAAA